MATIELVKAELCADCVHATANGEAMEGAEFAPLSKLYLNDSVSVNIDDEGASDPFFSWNNCDGCETNLGGERYACTIARTV